MKARDDPPLLKNLLIINWGPYDAATGISGDFEFRSDLQLVFFDEFGRVHLLERQALMIILLLSIKFQEIQKCIFQLME